MPNRFFGKNALPGIREDDALKYLAEHYHNYEAFLDELASLYCEYPGALECIHVHLHAKRETCVHVDLERKSSLSDIFTKGMVSLSFATREGLARWRETSKPAPFAESLPDEIRNIMKFDREEAGEWLGTLPDVLEVIEVAGELAVKRGLRTPWGGGLISWNLAREYRRDEPGIRQFQWIPITSFSMPLPSVNLRPIREALEEYAKSVPPYEQSREEQVLDVVRHEMARIELQKNEYLKEQGYKSELKKHVEWLYERIALKKPPIKIIRDHGPGQHAIEAGIRQVARMLEITLPSNRGPSIRRKS